MKKPNGRARRDTFLRLSHNLLDSEAWQRLNTDARALYIEIAARYNGHNNGQIPFSRREASERLQVAPATAVKAFSKLQEAGLITATRKGWNCGNFSRSTRWQINEHAQNSNIQPISDYRFHIEPVSGTKMNR